MGASVPITNDEPVGDVEFVLVFIDEPPLHPAINKDPTVSARREGRAFLLFIGWDISGTSLSANLRGLHGIIAGVDTGGV
jgi:hypothetical protein